MSQSTTEEFISFPSNHSAKSDRMAVILAGGDGSRLKSLTQAIAGDERPKQFCHILDGSTLLDKTRERVAIKIKPDNTFFSLTQKHEGFYKQPLWDVPANQLIVQPENKGTAPAILYSLMQIAKTAPNASVAFFPSDHYFSNDESFMEQAEIAFKAAALNPTAVVLLGVEPEKPETAYGWIEPSKSLFGGLSRSVSRVERFWEKPSSSAAKKLMAAGCLWNSFVMIGRVDAFLEMFRKHLPDLFRMFEVTKDSFGTAAESAAIRSIYSWIEETNFSSEVLEKATRHLMVMRVGEVGWCDWGEPHRVLGTLANLGIQTEWMRALAA
ncbi:MAG: sugar phosphate nucleotidyltransferase [Blastocatellia bacterium]